MGRPKKNVDHIAMMDGGAWRCAHCGRTFNPFEGKQGVEVGALVALAKWFQKEHANCPKPKEARCTFCHATDHGWEEHVNATTKDPIDWLDCGDTGISSRAIWGQMMGRPTPAGSYNGHPHDPSDLGRCLRLLAAPWASGWRDRLHEMKQHGPVWARLVDAWPEMEKLYAEEKAEGTGKAPRLYARMKQIIDGQPDTRGAST